jgi:hypothetical protein
MAFPVAALTWGALGSVALFRALYHPSRAVVADGFAVRCAGGSPCANGMTVDSFLGKAPVYAGSCGTVFRTTANAVYLASATEPTVLVYEGDPSKGGMQVQVQPGESVTVGQQIGLAERVTFSVYALWRNADGTVKVIPNEPAAWLATHGMKVSRKRRSGGGAGAQWCEAGRKLTVPQDVAQCGIRLSTPGAFMLLPVSATME